MAPFHNLAFADAPKSLNVLISAGCPIDLPVARSERTALHLALRRGNWKSCITLLRHGSSVHLADKEGNRALHHYAYAHEGNKTVLDLILAGGPEINAVNKAGLTPLDIAVRERANFTGNLPPQRDELLQAGGKRSEPK